MVKINSGFTGPTRDPRYKAPLGVDKIIVLALSPGLVKRVKPFRFDF